MQVKHADLTCENEQLISSISALEPTSMSWGNACDDHDAADVHRLARACSASGTPHFMHSIHWQTDIKGSRVLDYGIPNRFQDLVPVTFAQKAHVAERCEIFEDGRREKPWPKSTNMLCRVML